MTISFTKLETAVDQHAKKYEAALVKLETAAVSSGGNNTLSITDATVATTEVQIHQSLIMSSNHQLD